jgi:hypothetical protein
MRSYKEFSTSDTFKTIAAVVVSVFAMVLAISNIGSSNASGDATDNQILASNAYSFYQAKTIRQTDYKLFGEQMKLQLTEFPNMPVATREAIEKNIQIYSSNVQRYESEPETGEGKKELLERARKFEKLRDEALRKDPWFDYSEGLLQVAIVLASVAIVISTPALLVGSIFIGLIGSLCCLNGFYLFL